MGMAKILVIDDDHVTNKLMKEIIYDTINV